MEETNRLIAQMQKKYSELKTRGDFEREESRRAGEDLVERERQRIESNYQIKLDSLHKLNDQLNFKLQSLAQTEANYASLQPKYFDIQ
jgi:hypothetical protein